MCKGASALSASRTRFAALLGGCSAGPWVRHVTQLPNTDEATCRAHCTHNTHLLANASSTSTAQAPPAAFGASIALPNHCTAPATNLAGSLLTVFLVWAATFLQLKAPSTHRWQQ